MGLQLYSSALLGSLDLIGRLELVILQPGGDQAKSRKPKPR